MNLNRYVVAFAITAAIFGTAFYIASRIDSTRVADIRATGEAISIDLLSSEVQFELLGNLDCETLSAHPILTDELNGLADRLSFTENRLGSDNAEVIQLKKQYSLLEIKDYLLMQQITAKCKTKPVAVLYFYSNTGDCPDCGRMGDVLTYLRQTYPELRVYSFDYNLDLSALQTLIALRKVDGQLPAFIAGTRAPVYGFKSLDEMEKLIPELKTLATTTGATTKAATSTR
ncbi:MAG TPA: hypothetical protein VHD55_02790 [Candidatus Paceibacterota bacterium]|nr:hypothetical protein [Candidatus Paceibacterota bacterium]